MTLYNFPYVTRETRGVEFDASTTLALWTPRGSAVVCFDSMTISNNGASGTFALYWSFSSSSAPGAKIGVFTVGASTAIYPFFGLVEGTINGGTLWGRPSSSGTGGWSVFTTGFEKE
jgi:hypothetical protein